MSTLTLEVSDEVAEAVAFLPPSERAALDTALRSVAAAVVKAHSFPPRAVTWEEITGFTDEEEEDFAVNLGLYIPALAASSLPILSDPEEDKAWERLKETRLISGAMSLSFLFRCRNRAPDRQSSGVPPSCWRSALSVTDSIA